MGLGNGSQVRRVDDQFATLFDDCAELVARLATNPQLVVMLIEQRHDSLVFATGILDVNVPADFSGAAKGFAKIADE